MILTPEFDDQDGRFGVAFEILQHAIAERAFPAASLAVTSGDRLIALKSFGSFTYGDALGQSPAEREINEQVPGPATPFDLASLTKPIATTTMAMILYQRGVLDLNRAVADVIPDFAADSAGVRDGRRARITFRMLLTHSSGLPAYEKLFQRTQSKSELMRLAIGMPLTADPGSRAEYSDVGFIVLGFALEHIAQQSLEAFSQREIFAPLGMQTATFNPAADVRKQTPPTADERIEIAGKEAATNGSSATAQEQLRSTFRNRIVQGEVQDENAYVLGGIAGHAGLFASAEDVARFGHAILSRGAPILRRETIALMTLREVSPHGTTRTLGWDTPSNPSQSGRLLGPASYGHLGYTGTSLWIDPDRALTVTLLTNRTWPDCRNQKIKRIRPKVHDAIVGAIV